ncbi:MAG: DoxX family membrane protein [Elusimicrobia bacterium]|nr:DoxX family membrane protein [Elusimicrobiota bacterium]
MKPRAAVALAARVAVGAVMVFAGASKLALPAEEFARVIEAYGLVSASTALSMAGLLPWLEVLLGWALILGVRARWAAVAASALLASFLFALGHVILIGIPIPNCGCFGAAVHFTPAHAFLFDSLTLALCWIVFRSEPDPLSLDSWANRGL